MAQESKDTKTRLDVINMKHRAKRRHDCELFAKAEELEKCLNQDAQNAETQTSGTTISGKGATNVTTSPKASQS
jgi:hypothetical protein